MVTAPSSHEGRRFYYSLRALKIEMTRVYGYVDDEDDAGDSLFHDVCGVPSDL